MATVDLVLGTGPATPDPLTLVLGVGAGPTTPRMLVPSGPVAASWGDANRAGGQRLGAPWVRRNQQAGSGAVSTSWGRISSRIVGRTAMAWGTAQPISTQADMDWQRAGVIHARVSAPWQRARGVTDRLGLAWGRAGVLQARVGLLWGRAGPAQRPLSASWGPAGRIIGANPPLLPVVVPFPIPPVLNWTRLHFCPPGQGLHLRLGVDPCDPLDPNTLIVPARSSYVQHHTLTAIRLSDNAVVPLTGFSLDASDSAIGWTLSATGPAELLTLLAPASGAPARLRVTADGLVWEFVVEGLQRTRTFGQTNATITGRSASALLADPYCPAATYTNTVDMTAQQVLNDAIGFTGVGLDWRVTDWLIPATVWSYTGTIMGAIQQVAQSIGALVQSPRVGDNVIVAPRYPVLPWDWATATPDVLIESFDPVIQEGFQRNDKPDYDGVYVSGQAQGVLAVVKRTGSGPSMLIPLVTDPLITELDAARQRGEALLGAAGPQALRTLTMPVLTGSGEAGVIDPGKLVRVNDPDGVWYGLVRSTRVTADAVSLSQTITLEQHT